MLETDHEDASWVEESIQSGVRYIAEALDEPEEVVVEQTTANALALYQLSWIYRRGAAFLGVRTHEAVCTRSWEKYNCVIIIPETKTDSRRRTK